MEKNQVVTKTKILLAVLLLTAGLLAGERVTLGMAKQVALNEYRLSVIPRHYARGMIVDPYKEWDLPDEDILKKFTVDSLVHEGNTIVYYFNVTGNGSRGGCIDIAANTTTGGGGLDDESYYYGKPIYQAYLKDKKEFEEAKARGENVKHQKFDEGMIVIGAYLRNYDKKATKSDNEYWDVYLQISEKFKALKKAGFDQLVKKYKAKN